jgi:shikimate kinase
MIVALVGYRGTGKSTVAERLAARLSMQWVDADHELETEAGRSIKEIFAEQGESVFRDLEEMLTAKLMARDNLVVACGGGAVLREGNRQQLAKGRVVWLTASVQTLHDRIYADPSTSQRRPDLTASGGIAEIRAMLEQREPLYRSICDYEVDTDGKTPDQVVSQIVSLLN